MNEHILVGLVTLIGLGAGAQLVAWHVKVPSILVLLVFGLLAGPVLGLIEPHAILGDVTFPFISLGAAVILFEGGLTARWQDMHGIKSVVGRLATVGLMVTWVMTSSIAYYLGLSLSLSCLLGAILVVTGPTVIGPILRQARPSGQTGPILKYEGIINDPLGAILALIVFQVIQVESVETALSLIIQGVAKAVIISSALGFSASYIYVTARRKEWLPAPLENAILLPMVLCVYAISNHVQAESGLLAVTVMGIALASQKRVDMEASIEFSEHLRTMLISVLFILLTARIEWSDLHVLRLEGIAFVVLLIFVVRPTTVLLSTWGSDLTWKERLFLCLMAPRGIVAAAVSSVFAIKLTNAGMTEARALMPITFLVIAVCVVFYGLGARPLVRLLGLRQESAKGVLFLGANRITRALAEALTKANVPNVIVDTDRRKVMRCRSQGLRAEHGRLLSERVMNSIDLSEMGQLIALTSNDDVNTLAVQQFRHIIGKKKVFQVSCDSSDPSHEHKNTSAGRLKGGRFAPSSDYDDLLNWAAQSTVKLTPLSQEFDYEDMLRHNAGRTLPLLVLNEKGTPRILQDSSPPPKAGERVLSFVQEEEDSPRRPRLSSLSSPGSLF